MDDDIVTGSRTKVENKEVVMQKPVRKDPKDLNNDGKFDKDDKKIAAKTLASGPKKKK